MRRRKGSGVGQDVNETPLEADDKLVQDALEEARQSVKAEVERESKGEIINHDLLNFRLRRG